MPQCHCAGLGIKDRPLTNVLVRLGVASRESHVAQDAHGNAWPNSCNRIAPHHIAHEAVIWIGLSQQHAYACQNGCNIQSRTPCALTQVALVSGSGSMTKAQAARAWGPKWMASNNCHARPPHLWGHVEEVKADPASAIDIGMVHWRNEADLWRLEWIPGRDLQKHGGACTDRLHGGHTLSQDSTCQGRGQTAGSGPSHTPSLRVPGRRRGQAVLSSPESNGPAGPQTVPNRQRAIRLPPCPPGPPPAGPARCRRPASTPRRAAARPPACAPPAPCATAGRSLPRRPGGPAPHSRTVAPPRHGRPARPATAAGSGPQWQGPARPGRWPAGGVEASGAVAASRVVSEPGFERKGWEKGPIGGPGWRLPCQGDLRHEQQGGGHRVLVNGQWITVEWITVEPWITGDKRGQPWIMTGNVRRDMDNVCSECQGQRYSNSKLSQDVLVKCWA